MPAPVVAVLNESDTASSYQEWAGWSAHGVVHCWWEQRITAGLQGGGYVQRVLPDGCSDVIVSAQGKAVVVGPTLQVALPQLAPGTHVRGMRLRTEALASVWNCAGSELRDKAVALDDVLPAAAGRELARAVWERRAPEGLSRAPVDRRVRHAVARLRQSDRTDVASVASELGTSTRHLRRLLVDHTGLGPKAIQRTARLQRFVCLADRQWPFVPLAGLAVSAGYADQAHLSREVGEMAGITPLALLRERHR
jgi:AraC-like DNA-binding protein